MQIKVVKAPIKLQKQLEKIARGDFGTFLKPAGDEIVDDIIDNVRHQATPEGGALKKNAPETTRIKKRMGWGTLSLIAKFRMLITKSTYVVTTTKTTVQVTLIKVRKNVGKILEARGYRFFGISLFVRKKIFDEWRKIIKDGFR